MAAAADLFRHVSAEKSSRYRAIMEVFAAARRQYRLQLRPDEVLAEGRWPGPPPRLEELGAELSQLAEWGNLESQPDTARVSSLTDYYRARYLYRLSRGGEAVETALASFVETMGRRAELQSVALEDITSRLQALRTLLGLADAGGAVDTLAVDTLADDALDVAKLHETLRDLVRVFESLADNAQAFMAGVARSLAFQQAEATAVVTYKRRLIDYLERFIGDLVRRGDAIGRLIVSLEARIDTALHAVARREARDAAPGDEADRQSAEAARLGSWRERWQGLRGWFLHDGHARPQSDLLRAQARSAIPQLLGAIAAVNERRSGRSDRSADFRVLARWFAECSDDDAAHRLARAAFALHPARHFSMSADGDEVVAPNTPWAEAPPLMIHPRLREYGDAGARGQQARVQDRSDARAILARFLDDEAEQVRRAKAQWATGQAMRLSTLGELDARAFGLFLALLGEALAGQHHPDQPVERMTSDGTLRIRLVPLAPDSHARIRTPCGVFAGRDHEITVTATGTASGGPGRTPSPTAVTTSTPTPTATSTPTSTSTSSATTASRPTSPPAGPGHRDATV